MKKLFTLFLFSIIIHCHNTVTAQSLSIEETKTILCGHKWLLKTLEQDNKAVAVPEKLRGLKMVFKPDGYAYRFLPSQSESDKARQTKKWSITKTTLIIEDTVSGVSKVNIYSLTNVAGMKLQMTLDEPEQATFVFEQAEKTEDLAKSTDEDDGFYIPTTPAMDSSMKELAARINKAIADNKNIKNSEPNVKKIDGEWVFEKMNLSGYIIYFDDSNKDKQNLINAWIRMTGAEGDQDEKNGIIKNKELIYTGLKEIYKSSIEFKDMKYDQVIKGAAGNYTRNTGKLVFNEQGDDGKTGKQEVHFQITTSDYEDDGYNILGIEIPKTFHDASELKVKLKDNSLVLEKVESTGVEGVFHIIDEENIFILYFKKK